MMETIPPVSKPSQVMAWLGFGISLAVLLMIWGVNLLVLSHIGDRGFPAGALYVLVIMVGGVLGLMGFIFSIVGLVTATKNFLKKWPGICGIVFCCLSLISVFAPIVMASRDKETVGVQLPVQETDEIWCDDDVVIEITKSGWIKCYDNRSGVDENVIRVSVYSIDLQHELQTWMRMNGIDKNATFAIATETGADYSDVVDVIDTLKEMGIKKYRMQSNNSKRR